MTIIPAGVGVAAIVWPATGVFHWEAAFDASVAADAVAVGGGLTYLFEWLFYWHCKYRAAKLDNQEAVP